MNDKTRPNRIYTQDEVDELLSQQAARTAAQMMKIYNIKEEEKERYFFFSYNYAISSTTKTEKYGIGNITIKCYKGFPSRKEVNENAIEAIHKLTNYAYHDSEIGVAIINWIEMSKEDNIDWNS
jgi:hypothetical protein